MTILLILDALFYNYTHVFYILFSKGESPYNLSFSSHKTWILSWPQCHAVHSSTEHNPGSFDFLPTAIFTTLIISYFCEKLSKKVKIFIEKKKRGQ